MFLPTAIWVISGDYAAHTTRTRLIGKLMGFLFTFCSDQLGLQ